MALLYDPQAWLSFVMLAALEVVLGIDNVVFLAMLVNRLPLHRRGSARVLGLSFAMLTRIGLLFSITWLATLHQPLFAIAAWRITGRQLILWAGGGFLIVKSVLEIRDTLTGRSERHAAGRFDRFWLIIAQIGILDIAFSLDSVFTAVGLASRIEVMVAAIVASSLVMLGVAAAIGLFIERHPRIKLVALAFLVLIGAELIAEAFDLEPPKGYLYFAMGFSAVVECLNLRLGRRVSRP